MRAWRVGPDEVDALHAILAECGRDLSTRLGLSHWNPPHPLESMRAEAITREVYAVEDAGALIATFTIGTTPLPAYPATLFTPNTDPALYLNRLAVRPALQNRGVGRWCLHQIETRALALGCRAIRFDALAFLIPFYRAQGYDERGPFQIGPHPVVCFERLLT